ncbi:MAG TPA: ATP-dependent DNA helicase UvrD2 [Acidimicrobiales bacterium]
MDVAALLEGLDAAQREAVLSSGAPLCIVAPAGSGKTRVLTRRIARRVADGSVDARHVLAITFTRRAADELYRRLRDLGLRERPHSGTFHGIAYGVLRRRWADNRRPAPELLTSRVRLVSTVLDEMGRPGRAVAAGDVAGEIDWACARMVSPEGYPDAAREAQRRSGVPAALVAEAYQRYEQAKKTKRLVDFDDLLSQCMLEMRRDATFADVVRWRYRHLFVDEFQDVNPLQHALLETWRGDRPDLCVVGDPNQAIYGWNGADAGWLRDFTVHHREATVVRLATNYRCPPLVLRAAHAVLATGSDAGPEPMAAMAEGSGPSVHEAADEAAEVALVARLLREGRPSGRRWRSCAVLARTNAQLPPLEQALKAVGIPARLRGSATPLDAHEVRAFITGDRPSTPLAEILERLEGALATDDDGDLALSPSPALTAFATLGWQHVEEDPRATLATFRQWLATGNGDDDLGSDAVDLLTFHAAKGLEWPFVVVTGVEQGLVPHAGASTTDARAEEVRLFYVALTRAEEVLHVTWARQRGGKARQPSSLLTALTDASQPPPAVAPPALLLARHRPAGDPLLESLRDWRRRTAHAAGMPERSVCTDAALQAVATARPHSIDELAEIPEIGRLAAQRLGPRMLQALIDAGA